MAAYGTPTLRICPDCKQETDNFSAKAWCCRPCNTARAKQWTKDNPERTRRTKRNAQYKSKYGITLEEYEILVDLQDGKCAICLTDNPERLLCVDHCHQTGAVRGLLCDKCNTSIGRLGDTIESIERVLAYMKGEL